MNYKQKHLKHSVSSAFCWSCWADSNCRPHPYQGCALPTELQQQMATRKGLEPSTSGVTGRRSNQLSYRAILSKTARTVYELGRGRRIRTLGTRFWRPLLYQLSYTPMGLALLQNRNADQRSAGLLVGLQGLEPGTDRL